MLPKITDTFQVFAKDCCVCHNEVPKWGLMLRLTWCAELPETFICQDCLKNEAQKIEDKHPTSIPPQTSPQYEEIIRKRLEKRGVNLGEEI
jgi:hypothetical protein